MTGMSVDPLSPIESRIMRGVQHVEELERNIEKYVHSGRRRHGPYRIDHVRDGDDEWFLGKVRMMRDPQPYMGVIAGECVYQFSHALDNLMTAMVRLNHRSERAYWPYVTDASKWTKVEKGTMVRKGLRDLLAPAHYDLVYREQPFNRDPATKFEDWTVRDCVLWLRHLSNHDKHEAVHVGYTLPRRVESFRHETILGFNWLYDMPEPLKTGTLLYRVKFVDPRVQIIAMNIEPDVAFEVEPGVWIGAGAFRKMGESVMALVEEVARTTPAMSNWRTSGI